MKIVYKPDFGLDVTATLGSAYIAPNGLSVDAEMNGNTKFTGLGTLEGVVKVKDILSPGALVRLYEEESREYIAETITDSDGNFSFSGLNPDKKYFMVANDQLSIYEYRVTSRRVPVL